MSLHPDPRGENRTILPPRRESGTSPAPQPRSYSVDEMMTQLRAPEGKRRRRRSAQPVYEARRRRRLAVILGLALVALLLAAYFGFQFFQRMRLEGDTFREGLNRRLSGALGAQVTLTRVHHGGEESLSAGEARFDTRDTDLVEKGVFSGLNAALTPASWVTEDWGVTLLSVTGGEIRFNPARVPFAGDTTAWVPRTGGRERGTGGFRFGITPEPGKLTIDALRVTGGLDLVWPVAGSASAVESIRGLKGSVKFPPGRGWEGAFVNGTLQLQGLPAMDMDRVEWKLDGRKLQIMGGGLLLEGRDCVDVSGSATLTGEGSVELAVDFTEAPLKRLLSGVWADRVSGKLATTGGMFRAGFDPAAPERRYEGRFTVTGFVMKGLGFLNKLAFALQRPDLSIAEFPSLTGRFVWTPSGGLELSELMADMDGTLRLSGAVTIGPERISGELKAAAGEVALRARAAGTPHPFGETVDGWAAVNFKVSGTSAVVDDSLELPGLPPVRPGGMPAPRAPGPGKSAEDAEKQFNELLPK